MLESILVLISLIPKFFIVQSGSMEPAIKTGSIVVTAKAKNYVQGDIISFSKTNTPDTIVTHRIVYKDRDNFYTAGDANNNLDPNTINEGQIIGKKILTIPYIGYLAGFAKTPEGFILFIIIPATIIIYEEMRFLSKEFARFTAKFRQNLNLRFHFNFFKFLSLTLLVGYIFAITAYSISYFSDNETTIDNTLGASDTYEQTQ